MDLQKSPKPVSRKTNSVTVNLQNYLLTVITQETSTEMIEISYNAILLEAPINHT